MGCSVGFQFEWVRESPACSLQCEPSPSSRGRECSMGDTGTVGSVATARWGVRLGRLSGRFAEPGWSYEEPVARPCPRCAGQLHSLRKPYVSNGKPYRYVALVCPACPAVYTLADLGAKVYDQVMRPGRPVQAATGARPERRTTPESTTSAVAGKTSGEAERWVRVL